MQDLKSGQCYICSRWYGRDWQIKYLEKHHVIYGKGNRKLSEKYGLTVMLCRHHHQGDINGASDAIHNNPDKTNDLRLKREAERAWIKKNGTEEQFIKIFGESYL
jgi:hypothetical protein